MMGYLGEWMVSNGWALAYRQYSKDYMDEETATTAAKQGLWTGEFVAPWEWRRR
jgi:endonuclease YncB( thermonuclease family)